tara:strand:+ start:6986 stop:9526 length:2541 start_codon:yes stop_codon:yes gene_type:complete
MADLFTRRGDLEAQSALNKGQTFTQFARMPEQTMSMLWQLEDRKRQIARDEENQRYMASLRANQERAARRLDRQERDQRIYNEAVTQNTNPDTGLLDAAGMRAAAQQNPQIVTQVNQAIANNRTFALNEMRYNSEMAQEGVASLLAGMNEVYNAPPELQADQYDKFRQSFNQGIAALQEDGFSTGLDPFVSYGDLQARAEKEGTTANILMGDQFKSAIAMASGKQAEFDLMAAAVEDVEATEGPMSLAVLETMPNAFKAIVNMFPSEWVSDAGNLNDPSQQDLDNLKKLLTDRGSDNHLVRTMQEALPEQSIEIWDAMGFFTASTPGRGTWAQRIGAVEDSEGFESFDKVRAALAWNEMVAASSDAFPNFKGTQQQRVDAYMQQYPDQSLSIISSIGRRTAIGGGSGDGLRKPPTSAEASAWQMPDSGTFASQTRSIIVDNQERRIPRYMDLNTPEVYEQLWGVTRDSDGRVSHVPDTTVLSLRGRSGDGAWQSFNPNEVDITYEVASGDTDVKFRIRNPDPAIGDVVVDEIQDWTGSTPPDNEDVAGDDNWQDSELSVGMDDSFRGAFEGVDATLRFGAPSPGARGSDQRTSFTEAIAALNEGRHGDLKKLVIDAGTVGDIETARDAAWDAERLREGIPTVRQTEHVVSLGLGQGLDAVADDPIAEGETDTFRQVIARAFKEHVRENTSGSAQDKNKAATDADYARDAIAGQKGTSDWQDFSRAVAESVSPAPNVTVPSQTRDLARVREFIQNEIGAEIGDPSQFQAFLVDAFPDAMESAIVAGNPFRGLYKELLNLPRDTTQRQLDQWLGGMDPRENTRLIENIKSQVTSNPLAFLEYQLRSGK